MTGHFRPLGIYRVLLGIGGLAALAFALSGGNLPALRPEQALFLVFFIALLAHFPLLLFSENLTLTPAACVAAGALYGWPAATAFTALGLVFEQVVHSLRDSKAGDISGRIRRALMRTGLNYGLLMVPLFASSLLIEGRDILRGSSADPGASLILGLAFGLVHGALLLIHQSLASRDSGPVSANTLLALGLIELLPLPFVFLATVAFPVSEAGALIALGGLPAILAVTLNGAGLTRQSLERRLGDLSTLTSISYTLQSTLAIDELLPAIQQQITAVLGIDNFYVALHDAAKGQIWYPMAVKHGQSQSWSRRAVADRLTDRVIQESRPILLARDAPEQLDRIGLPRGEDPPEAWLGVPIITPQGTLGCLAVFSATPRVSFTPSDQRLLTILSAQVGVAIHNALLYDQTQRRAVQLEKLNRITGVITASLNPQEVLSAVCQSVTEVVGAQRSAIFLMEEATEGLHLAHAHGLSRNFRGSDRLVTERSQPTAQSLRTGRPSLQPDLAAGAPANPYQRALLEENVRAAGEFPLITPEGPLGMLSVYFDQPHPFPPEQIELLQTFAAQAALAVSNARLYASTDMALSRRAHQLAILESIGRQLSAAAHSEHLFELILDYALDFTNAPWGNIGLLDLPRQRIEFKASRGYISQPSFMPLKHSPANEAVRQLSPVNLGEMRPDGSWQDLTGGAVQSHLSVPLIHEGQPLGILTLESPQAGAFTANDEEFISQLALQGAIAVVNASLYAETRQRLKDQATLYEFSKRLVGDLNLAGVTRTITEAVQETLQAHATGIYFWDRSMGAYVRYREVERHPRRSAGHLPLHLENEFWQKIEPVSVGTGVLRFPDRMADQTPLSANCQGCQVLVLELRIAEELLGVIITHLPADTEPGEDELQLARSFATQGAIAIQNAGLFTDIAQGRDRLEAVLNSIEEGVLMVDAEGRVILANAALETITRVPIQRLRELKIQDLPDAYLGSLGLSRDDTRGLINRLQRNNRLHPERRTFQLVHPEERVLVRFLAPVWGQDQGAIGWVLVLRDISEEHRLNQARELITETLVHDLRSPIGTMSSALQILDDSIPEGERDPVVSQTLEIARRSTDRVLNLIESLLDVSRLESGAIALEISEFSLYPVVTDLQAEYVPQANDLGLLLHNHVPEDLPPVAADREKIGRVLANLIDNALKFTPSGGQVTVTAEALGEEVLVSVHDTGPGIPDQYRETIFDRFTQVPGQRGSRRGSGIGLTFCRMAVEAHGGRIWVESSPEGGSLFRFTLSKAQADPA